MLLGRRVRGDFCVVGVHGVRVGLTVGLLVNSLSAMGRGDALISYQILCWKTPIRSPKELTVVYTPVAYLDSTKEESCRGGRGSRWRSGYHCIQY